MVDPSEIEAANRRGKVKSRQGGWAMAARYDVRSKRVIIVLGRGVELALVPGEIEGLEKATPEELSDIEISPKGFGLHFPKLDADLYVPAPIGWDHGFEGLVRRHGATGWAGAQLGQDRRSQPQLTVAPRRSSPASYSGCLSIITQPIGSVTPVTPHSPDHMGSPQ